MSRKKQEITKQPKQEFKEVKVRHERSIYLFDEIDYKISKEVIEKLIKMNDDRVDYIFLYINSPGGCVQSGLAICDVIMGLESKVIAVCTGGISSMATVVAASCDEVCATTHSRFMIHDVAYGYYGKIDNQRVKLESTKILSDYVFEILSDKMGCSADFIKDKCEYDWYMTSTEAKKNKLVDNILDNSYLPTLTVKVPINQSEIKEDKNKEEK